MARRARGRQEWTPFMTPLTPLDRRLGLASFNRTAKPLHNSDKYRPMVADEDDPMERKLDPDFQPTVLTPEELHQNYVDMYNQQVNVLSHPNDYFFLDARRLETQINEFTFDRFTFDRDLEAAAAQTNHVGSKDMREYAKRSALQHILPPDLQNIVMEYEGCKLVDEHVFLNDSFTWNSTVFEFTFPDLSVEHLIPAQPMTISQVGKLLPAQMEVLRRQMSRDEVLRTKRRSLAPVIVISQHHTHLQAKIYTAQCPSRLYDPQNTRREVSAFSTTFEYRGGLDQSRYRTLLADKRACSMYSSPAAFLHAVNGHSMFSCGTLPSEPERALFERVVSIINEHHEGWVDHLRYVADHNEALSPTNIFRGQPEPEYGNPPVQVWPLYPHPDDILEPELTRTRLKERDLERVGTYLRHETLGRHNPFVSRIKGKRR